MDTTLDRWRKRLRHIGAKRWDFVAEQTGISYSTIRKLAYAETTPNYGNTLRLRAFFADLHRGRIKLPPRPPRKPRAPETQPRKPYKPRAPRTEAAQEAA